ncbi:D-glycerate dehydrogenase [Bacillus spongiae]|uniref:D-glycerate dehydrogenase n=1 Tax=Bacillus spongiae TaxID=2683610 RepID=A0ABU8HEZ3_9BACI
MKPFVYITRKLPEEIIQPLQDNFDVEMWYKEDEPVPREVLLNKVEKASALLTMLSEKVDSELLERGKQLKIIANMAVGYDNIDLNVAEEKGVLITNTPDVLTETTADLAFSLILMTARRTIEAASMIQDGKWTSWAPRLLAGVDVHHKTIGIYGMGKIGQAVAHRARGFHMRVLYHNRKRLIKVEQDLGATYVSFQQLLSQSDFVVCLAPLTAETKGIFGIQEFKQMKSSGIFINAARGAIVKEVDLIEALKQREIAGAGLDVFEKEPIDSDNQLLTFPNVVSLPHIGSATEETRRKMMSLCVQNIEAVLTGNKPITLVR